MPHITSNSSTVTLHLEPPTQNGGLAFYPGMMVRGYVMVETNKPYGLKHHGLKVELKGTTTLTVDASVVGLLDSFALGDPIGVTWVYRQIDLDCPSPAFPPGMTKLEFELPLATNTNRQMYESQRGIQINTTYVVMATLNRPGLSLTEMGPKTLSDEVEIFVMAPLTEPPSPIPPTKFKMHPSTSTLVVGASSAFAPTANFELVGTVDTRCDLDLPIQGHVQIEHASCPIEQIEVQIVRIETVPWTSDETIREEAEVVRCQVVDGDVARGIGVPFQLLLPRLNVAPSVHVAEFSIGFELNFIVELADGSIWRGTLDLVLFRGEHDNGSLV